MILNRKTSITKGTESCKYPISAVYIPGPERSTNARESQLLDCKIRVYQINQLPGGLTAY